MSSASVLDSIIEGVRVDVAAREAVVSLDELKVASKAAPPPLNVMAALREPGIGVIRRNWPVRMRTEEPASSAC